MDTQVSFTCLVDSCFKDIRITPDLNCKGAAAVYWNRKKYVDFSLWMLNFRETKDNILYNILWNVLSLTEMIAQSRVYSILNFTIVILMRYLVGCTHKLGKYDWSPRSLDRICDTLEAIMKEIIIDPTKFRKEVYIMNIWQKYEDEVV